MNLPIGFNAGGGGGFAHGGVGDVGNDEEDLGGARVEGYPLRSRLRGPSTDDFNVSPHLLELPISPLLAYRQRREYRGQEEFFLPQLSSSSPFLLSFLLYLNEVAHSREPHKYFDLDTMDYQGGSNSSRQGGRGNHGWGRGRGGRNLGGGDGSGRGRSEQNMWQEVGSSRRGQRGGYDGGRGGRSSGAPPMNRGRGGGQWSTPPPTRGSGGGQWSTPPPTRGSGGGQRSTPPPTRGAYGGGRGGRMGASSSGSSAGSLAMQLAKLQIPHTPEIVDGKRVPMPCPDNRGTLGNHTLDLLVNHFQLNFDQTFSVLHYEIDINLERDETSAETKISKSTLAAIKQDIFKNQAPSLPDDGGKNIFSPVNLVEGKYHVKALGKSYIVSVVLHKRLSIGDLLNAPCPRETLRALDVILRMNSARFCIQKGSNFFMPNRSRDLGYGTVALEGFKQSIKPTENGLVVCVDHSVMAFRKSMLVIDFIKELGLQIDKHRQQLSGRDKGKLERALKGMRVSVTHRRSRKKFEIQGLTQKNTRDITFTDEKSQRQRSLLDYYMEAYQIDIRYKMLPCLSLSKTKTNYVPMELCMITEGQLIPKEVLHRDGNEALKSMAIVHPRRRMDTILNIVKNDKAGPCRGKILDGFHLELGTEMSNVTARILERPALKLLDASGKSTNLNISNSDCQWNLLQNKMLRGRKVDYWAVLDFGRWQQSRRSDGFDVAGFIEDIVKRCGNLGVPMNEPLFVEQQDMNILSYPDKLRDVLRFCKRECGDYHLQLLICPMAEKDDGYKTLKLICETEMGLITQCFLTSNMWKRKDQFLANLALKINAKLGGSNFELSGSLPGMDPNSPILFIGADVNHPGARNRTSPSIVAVVASMNWPASNSYASILQAQKHRKENIIDIGRMCSQLLEKFSRANSVRPKHILYFRDGVSDSQFDMVLNEELTEIKMAIESHDYKPKITVVVAQKRHQTRLFVKDSNDPLATRSGNVPPGTVVDKGITARNLFNFFLCSHNGLRGTSKPTHYYVLWDEFGYTSDGIQQLIYNLCFSFARCTKPVSLVPPVYYADILAYRGRNYYEAMMDSSPSPSHSSSSSSSSTSAETIKFPELHTDIKDCMFFL